LIPGFVKVGDHYIWNRRKTIPKSYAFSFLFDFGDYLEYQIFFSAIFVVFRL